MTNNNNQKQLRFTNNQSNKGSETVTHAAWNYFSVSEAYLHQTGTQDRERQDRPPLPSRGGRGAPQGKCS